LIVVQRADQHDFVRDEANRAGGSLSHLMLLVKAWSRTEQQINTSSIRVTIFSMFLQLFRVPGARSVGELEIVAKTPYA
jgi:hypothetical protein